MVGSSKRNNLVRLLEDFSETAPTAQSENASLPSDDRGRGASNGRGTVALGQVDCVEPPLVTQAPTVADSAMVVGIMQCAAWAAMRWGVPAIL